MLKQKQVTQQYSNVKTKRPCIMSSLSDQAEALMERFRSMPADKIGSFYDSMDPEVYDEMVRMINATESDHILTKIIERDLGPASEIYDVGCGTGLMGKLLREKGFEKIDGMDASEQFVSEALRRGYYRSCECFYLGERPLPKEQLGRYDLVTAHGVWVPSHMPANAIVDCVSALKEGGYFITALRAYLWEKGESHGYRDTVDAMVDEGKLIILESGRFMRGVDGGNAMFAPQESVYIVAQRAGST